MAEPIFPDPLEVRRAHGADDLYRLTGWYDRDGYHPGDLVPRVTRFGGGPWRLWYLVRRDDGETVLTSIELSCADCDEAEILRRVRLALATYTGVTA